MIDGDVHILKNYKLKTQVYNAKASNIKSY